MSRAQEKAIVIISCILALSNVFAAPLSNDLEQNLVSSTNDTPWVLAERTVSYAPFYALCTSNSLVRKAGQTISTMESEYVVERKRQAKLSLEGFFRNSSLASYLKLLGDESITIAIAMSGGGYRAMLSGAGVLSALDERTPNATQHLGGILQSSTYIAGISGGSWLVANNLLNDGAPFVEAIRSQNFDAPLIEGVADVPLSQLRSELDPGSFGFHRSSGIENMLSLDINETNLEKPKSLVNAILSNFFKTGSESAACRDLSNDSTVDKLSLGFYRDLSIEVRAKKEAGFKVSITDYWGRAVSKKIFPPTKRSVDLTLSSATQLPSFQNFSQLFPIFVSVERLPHLAENSINSHLFEFNPYEFGSWDSFLDAFVDIKYLGTELYNGFSTTRTKIEDYALCVLGYDNLGFIIGTSSSLFNTLLRYFHEMILTMEEQFSTLFSMVLKIFGISSHSAMETLVHPEYALYSPNPFKGSGTRHARGRSISQNNDLFLADGGDDGQNIPFHPLLVRGRSTEIIFAFDASSDHQNYPNGSSLRSTARRYHSSNSSLRVPLFHLNGSYHRIFPSVPSEQEHLSSMRRGQPIFLGCEISRDYPKVQLPMPHLSNDIFQQSRYSVAANEHSYEVWESYIPPLIVYFQNYHHTYPSNTSTFRTIYSDREVNDMIENGYNAATNMNCTEYTHCVGCAILQRRARTSEMAESFYSSCSACFDKYCYSPTPDIGDTQEIDETSTTH